LLIVYFQATINIVFDRVGKVDPVTRGIEIAVDYLGIQFDVCIACIDLKCVYDSSPWYSSSRYL